MGMRQMFAGIRFHGHATYRHVTPNGVVVDTMCIPLLQTWNPDGVMRAHRHGSCYRYGSPTGMMAGSFSGTVATDMDSTQGWWHTRSIAPVEPRQGFPVCRLRFPRCSANPVRGSMSVARCGPHGVSAEPRQGFHHNFPTTTITPATKNDSRKKMTA